MKESLSLGVQASACPYSLQPEGSDQCSPKAELHTRRSLDSIGAP